MVEKTTYSKVVMSCGYHSFSKPVQKPVLYCTISLYICTRYLDVAMPYLDVTKGSRIILESLSVCHSRAFSELHEMPPILAGCSVETCSILNWNVPK